jgi:nitrite reductase (NADH) small subunit
MENTVQFFGDVDNTDFGDADFSHVSAANFDALPTPQPLAQQWVDVCAVEDIPAGGGVNALVAGQQVAVFRLHTGRLLAISNFDPFTRANVLSRGIVGTTVRDGRSIDKVASPLLKHGFDLETGQSLDDPRVFVPVYAVRTQADRVLVAHLP